MDVSLNWFDYVARVQWMDDKLSNTGVAALSFAVLGYFAGYSLFLVLWFTAAGLMILSLAVALYWSGTVVQNVRRNGFQLKVKNYSRRPSLYTRVHTRICVRAYRRAPRSVSSHTSKGNSDSGGSDSEGSDAQPPALPVYATPLTFYPLNFPKLNDLLNLWACLGCWHVHCAPRGCMA